MLDKKSLQKNTEIERKFLITALPKDLELYPYSDMKQGYVMADNDGTLRIREIRSQDHRIEYYLTVKKGKGLIKTEVELSISHNQFNKLWESIDGRCVVKRRYEIPVDSGYIAELDVYEKNLSGLLTVEVEFESVSKAEMFIPPSWFGFEVTTDNRYGNFRLAIDGLPQ